VNVRRSALHPVPRFCVSWVQDKPGLIGFIYEKCAIFTGKTAKFPLSNPSKSDTFKPRGVLVFYREKGFVQNTERPNKKHKTLRMRKGIYCQFGVLFHGA
jgi:hypothetical protein